MHASSPSNNMSKVLFMELCNTRDSNVALACVWHAPVPERAIPADALPDNAIEVGITDSGVLNL
jgi:hypothetical protein